MAVGVEKVSTLLAQVDVLGCKALTLRGVIFVERGAWAGGVAFTMFTMFSFVNVNKCKQRQPTDLDFGGVDKFLTTFDNFQLSTRLTSILNLEF